MSSRLCHLSDPHVGGAKGALAVLDHLVGDAVDKGAEHVLVTGDVVERPSTEDLREVVRVLKRHGMWSPERCTLLPGNHDVSGMPDDPVFGNSRQSRLEALRSFVGATGHVNRPVPGGGRRLFAGRPVLKKLGSVRLLCLSSVSLDDSVGGELLEEDLLFLKEAFRGRKWGPRVVALHHHPYSLPVGDVPVLGRFIPPGLAGGESFLRACERSRVDLILHGHLHTTGRPFDRSILGMRVNCQGTAKGEMVRGRRRFGYDLYDLAFGKISRKRRFFDSAGVVDGLLGGR